MPCIAHNQPGVLDLLFFHLYARDFQVDLNGFFLAGQCGNMVFALGPHCRRDIIGFEGLDNISAYRLFLVV